MRQITLLMAPLLIAACASPLRKEDAAEVDAYIAARPKLGTKRKRALRSGRIERYITTTDDFRLLYRLRFREEPETPEALRTQSGIIREEYRAGGHRYIFRSGILFMTDRIGDEAEPLTDW